MSIKNLLIKSLNESTTEALAVASLTTTPIDNNTHDSTTGLISSTIFIKGDVTGKIIFVSSEESACKIVSKMLMDSIDTVTADVIDGIGEIVNITIGGIKSRVFNEGYNCEISIPSTKTTTNLKENTLSDYEVIEQNFSCEEDITFQIKLIFKPKKNDTPPPKKEEETKPKQSAADMLAALIAKNK